MLWTPIYVLTTQTLLPCTTFILPFTVERYCPCSRDPYASLPYTVPVTASQLTICLLLLNYKRRCVISLPYGKWKAGPGLCSVWIYCAVPSAPSTSLRVSVHYVGPISLGLFCLSSSFQSCSSGSTVIFIKRS